MAFFLLDFLLLLWMDLLILLVLLRREHRFSSVWNLAPLLLMDLPISISMLLVEGELEGTGRKAFLFQSLLHIARFFLLMLWPPQR